MGDSKQESFFTPSGYPSEVAFTEARRELAYRSEMQAARIAIEQAATSKEDDKTDEPEPEDSIELNVKS